jgi:hypothetical protein
MFVTKRLIACGICSAFILHGCKTDNNSPDGGSTPDESNEIVARPNTEEINSFNTKLAALTKAAENGVADAEKQIATFEEDTKRKFEAAKKVDETKKNTL